MIRWWRKVRRRRGGVYLWRVDHHINRARRVNGYVGETTSYYFREKDQLGRGRAGGEASWSDLNPKRYKVIPLPWWLCWKLVLLPLETLVIVATWPVYNDAKNRWNPRRIRRDVAKVQRSVRDQGGLPSQVQVWAAHSLRAGVQAAVLLAVFGSLALWLAGR